MMRSKLHIAASTHEGQVPASRRAGPERHRRLHSHSQSAGCSRDSILHTIGIVADFPELGVRVDEGVRRIKVRRYEYKVYYEVDEAKHELVVTTVRHPRRQPL
jgi:plasmid stabilization system protein ParE